MPKWKIDWSWDLAGRIGTGVVVAAVVIAWPLSVPTLKARVSDARADLITPESVRVSWPGADGMGEDGSGASGGTWLTDPAVRSWLTQVVTSGVRVDPFDVASLVSVQRALMETGWFEDPPTVRRRPGNMIEVEGVWRVPAAVVVHGGLETLVGLDSVPMSTPADADLSRFVRITSPRYGAPTGAGEAWLGGDVKDAIELLDVLNRAGALTPDILAIDLSAHASGRTNQLRILTDGRGVLVWGSAPGRPTHSEVSTEEKLRHLRLALDPSTFGGAIGAEDVVVLHGPVVSIDRSVSPSRR